MPLIKSKSKRAFNENVAELIKTNKDKSSDKKRPMKQILAIAYQTKRDSKEK